MEHGIINRPVRPSKRRVIEAVIAAILFFAVVFYLSSR